MRHRHVSRDESLRAPLDAPRLAMKSAVPARPLRSLAVAFSLSAMLACGTGTSDAGIAALTNRDRILLASARVVLPPPGVRFEDLPDPAAPGARLLAEYCVQCHELPTPSIHSAADWPRVARRMWLRAEGVAEDFGVPVPDPAQRLLMLRYLIDNALRVPGAVLPEGPDRKTFATLCSRCHDLPDPKQYSPAQWSPVVSRMIQLTEMALNDTVSEEEVAAVETYLRTVSSPRY